MEKEQNPKQFFLDRLLNITREFEGITGVEVKHIDFDRICVSDFSDSPKTTINKINLELT